MTRRRTAHGNAAARGATVVYETPPTDELRPVPPDAADPIARRGNGTFTPEGAAAAARRRAELAKLPDFAEGELDFIPADAFAPFDAARRELTLESGRDLATSTGGLSRSVWTIVRGACWLTSFAEYWATVAAQTGDPEAAERASRLFQRASVERVKAEDLAAREAEARPRANPNAAAAALFARPAPTRPVQSVSAPASTSASSVTNGASKADQEAKRGS